VLFIDKLILLFVRNCCSSVQSQELQLIANNPLFNPNFIGCMEQGEVSLFPAKMTGSIRCYALLISGSGSQVSFIANRHSMKFPPIVLRSALGNYAGHAARVPINADLLHFFCYALIGPAITIKALNSFLLGFFVRSTTCMHQPQYRKLSASNSLVNQLVINICISDNSRRL
jgi:hypothetical protein